MDRQALTRSSLIILVGVALAGAFGGVLVVGHDDPMPSAESEAVPVVLREVRQVERPAYVSLSGDLMARRTARVGFMVPGRVERVAVEEGDPVRAGQLLATLDPEDYELNLALARVQRERAEDEHRRATMMREGGAVPAADYHRAETALKQARAQEALAEKKVRETRLVSPLPGIVAMRSVNPGEQTGPGTPTFVIVDIGTVRARVGVPEAEIGKVAVGQDVLVSVPSLSGATFEGRVSLVGVAADPASRTYTLKVDIDNEHGRLRPGMIAEARIATAERVNALTVPGEAIVRDADEVTRVFVYAADEGRVYSRRVAVGSVYGRELEIRSGLSAGERVVIGGQHRVREGSRVVVSSDGAGN